LWEDEIKRGIAESAFLIPIVTPSAVGSKHCRFEFESFLQREAELGRNNLIFPILYVRVPGLETDEQWRRDEVLKIIGARQYFDWQRFRLRSLDEPDVAERIEQYCRNIIGALQQPWLSPEQRRAEEEGARQEAVEKARGSASRERLARETEERRRAKEAERLAREAEQRREAEEKEVQPPRRSEDAPRRREANAAQRVEREKPDESPEAGPSVHLTRATGVVTILAAAAVLVTWMLQSRTPSKQSTALTEVPTSAPPLPALQAQITTTLLSRERGRLDRKILSANVANVRRWWWYRRATS
jgi:hypothetical protein